MSDSTSSNGGVGFVSLLTILFIGLKLTGHISWSWWWVLSPMLIVLSLILVITLLLAIAEQKKWQE